MQINGSFWASAPVQAAVAADDVGTVIRLTRRRMDLNQTQLGRLCGYSVSTISRIERGLPPIQDVHVRRLVGDVLGIPLECLGLAGVNGRRSTQVTRVESIQTGHVGVRVVATTAGRGDPVRRRDVLSGLTASAAAAALPWPGQRSPTKATLAELLDAESAGVAPVAVRELAGQLRAAGRSFSSSRYDQLTGRLAALIAGAAGTARHGSAGDEETATVLLAASYRLASELCVKRNDDALGWVLADRALAAARATGRPAPIAHATRSVAVAMRRAGHHDDAISLLSATAIRMQPGRQPTDAELATYGSLLCTAAYAGAQAGRRAEAVSLMDEANEAAGRLSATVADGEITFSTTNVAIYQIGIFTALGESATALDHAAGVVAESLETPERYARYCIDTARAWEQHGRHDRATQALCAAENYAPQELRRPSSHELIIRMLYAPRVTPSDLRGLAVRVGAIR